MFGSLGKVVGAARDRASEAAAGAYLRGKIQDFGELKALQIDSQAKKIRLEVALKGEVSPVEVVVEAYEIRRANGETFFVARQVKASREWLGIALTKFVVDREFKVPGAAGAIL